MPRIVNLGRGEAVRESVWRRGWRRARMDVRVQQPLAAHLMDCAVQVYELSGVSKLPIHSHSFSPWPCSSAEAEHELIRAAAIRNVQRDMETGDCRVVVVRRRLDAARRHGSSYLRVHSR
eukprot:4889964-Prymnesium_polylepis.1